MFKYVSAFASAASLAIGILGIQEGNSSLTVPFGFAAALFFALHAIIGAMEERRKL